MRDGTQALCLAIRLALVLAGDCIMQPQNRCAAFRPAQAFCMKVNFGERRFQRLRFLPGLAAARRRAKLAASSFFETANNSTIVLADCRYSTSCEKRRKDRFLSQPCRLARYGAGCPFADRTAPLICFGSWMSDRIWRRFDENTQTPLFLRLQIALGFGPPFQRPQAASTPHPCQLNSSRFCSALP